MTALWPDFFKEALQNGAAQNAAQNGARMPSPQKTEAAEQARRLMRSCREAALATAMRNDCAWPYPSFVPVAWDETLSPLLFISGLAEHARNLVVDPRAGLLILGPENPDEPLARPRLSLLGTVERADSPESRAMFVAAHPAAQRMTALGDFAIHKMTVDRAHLIAGFGAARWIDGASLRGA